MNQWPKKSLPSVLHRTMGHLREAPERDYREHSCDNRMSAKMSLRGVVLFEKHKWDSARWCDNCVRNLNILPPRRRSFTIIAHEWPLAKCLPTAGSLSSSFFPWKRPSTKWSLDINVNKWIEIQVLFLNKDDSLGRKEKRQLSLYLDQLAPSSVLQFVSLPRILLPYGLHLINENTRHCCTWIIETTGLSVRTKDQD